jgi:cytoskeletal protein CcmA (bactofilin family)
MLQVNQKLQDDLETPDSTKPALRPAIGAAEHSQRASAIRLAAFPKGTQSPANNSQLRPPAFIGEVSFRGTVPVEGVITGSPGTGGSMTIKQHQRTSGSQPEMDGALTFRDMLRVNGHIAGSVISKKGTLIVDITAQVDADIEVSVAVIGGRVNGDIVAYQRVELGPFAKIHGNIWTRSLAIQPGAIFDGVCQMIEEKEDTN